MSLFGYWQCRFRFAFGGDDGIRTHDPLLAGQVLSQLSYTPITIWAPDRFHLRPFPFRFFQSFREQTNRKHAVCLCWP